jgi:hypothetical protein
MAGWIYTKMLTMRLEHMENGLNELPETSGGFHSKVS